MDALIRAVAERGDLAHVALALWAIGASLAFWRAFAEVARAQRRFDDFVRELARFNARHGSRE
jgi:hypothetical protein